LGYFIVIKHLRIKENEKSKIKRCIKTIFSKKREKQKNELASDNTDIKINIF